jgi:NHL repeat-containing protein
MTRRRSARMVLAGLIITASMLVAAAPVAADGPRSHVEVLLDGLSSPKGIDVGPSSVFVGQGAFGRPGPVLEYIFKGKGRGTTTPITGPLNLIDIAGTPDGAGWGIGGDGVLYRQATANGTPSAILNIRAYQAADPDPYNSADGGLPTESNPYGLAALRTNEVLIADAAGNDIIRVNKNGKAVTVARFKRERVKTSHLGDPTLPKTILAEAVPTSIAIGRDGWAYVGQLMGYPGRPKTSHIWRVNPYRQNAVCSASSPNRKCKVWKSGFTSIIDLAINPRNGTLYVYEIARKGWLAFEEGFTTGVFPPAVLLEVRGNRTRELVRGKLSQPGGVAVSPSGAIFVTDGMFGNGRLLRVWKN